MTDRPTPSTGLYGEGGTLPSPCTGHCRIDPATGWCEGCLRTQQEITAWWRMPDDGRREVLQRLVTRRASPNAPHP